MSSYSLDKLEPGTFENIIQSLCQGIFGVKLKIYGSGTDGQREAVFEGDNNFEIISAQLSGRSIFQAKYKDNMTKKDDYTWLREQLKKELDGFQEKNKTEPEFIPKNYLFFTNVVLTAVKDIGVKDKIDKFIEGYKKLIPNIYVIGYDEICAMLDNNREVATSYASFIYSGDVLTKLYDYISFKENLSIETLMRFMEKEFQDDSLSRMEQAGMVAENKLSLQRVFIDLKVNTDIVASSSNSSYKFVQQIIKCGNTINRKEESNNKLEDNKYVLIGNAGQGKSTLCQFVTQIYRAFFLNNSSNCPISENINTFIEEFKKYYNYKIECFRIPIRIVLKDYADWITKSQQNNKSYSIINFILHKIKLRDGSYIHIDDFRVLLSKYSWLFIFDGLDEVPSSSNREDVLSEINNFVDIDLRRLRCDNIIIATSRPQGYSESFDANHYRHLQLMEMDDELCISYLNKLMKNIEPNQDKIKEYMNILEEAIKNNIISKLMRTPLQATIIAILVKSGGKPPKNRYNLFSEYYRTIVNREKQKGIIETLNDDLGWIDDIHYKIGFILQSESEVSDNPSAVLKEDKLMEIIKEYISEKEDEEESNIKNIENKAKLLFEIIVLRLTFICEVQDTIYGFPIRSIQEFFAANYITKNQKEEIILSTVKKISESAYWRNVLLFTLGYINAERIYLEGNIDSLCGELNGSDLEYGESTVDSIICAGSWLALDILIEGIFKSNSKIENKYLAKVSKLLELEVTEKFTTITLLPPRLLKKFLDNNLVPYLQRNSNNRSVWYIMGIIYKLNNTEALAIIREFWPKDDFCIIVAKMYIEQLRLLEDMEGSIWLFESICNSKFIDKIHLSLEQCEILASYILNGKIKEDIISYLLKSTLLSLRVKKRSEKNSCENLKKLFKIDIINLGAVLDLFDTNYNGMTFEVVGGYEIYFNNISDVSDDKELLENAKKILEKYDVMFYYQYINFYINPNYENLVRLLEAYVEEQEETQELIREQLEGTNWILEYINIRYLRTNKVNYVIEMYSNKVEDDLWNGIDNSLCDIMQNEDINNYKNNENLKYTTVSCSHSTSIMKEFMDLLEIDFEKLNEYSESFVAELIFITSVCIRANKYDLDDSKMIEYSNIRNLYEYYTKTTLEEKWVKIWEAPITLLILLNSDNSTLLNDSNIYDYNEFELCKVRHNLSKNTMEKILNKIISMILFLKQETNLLKVVQGILTFKSLDYSKINININDVEYIKCSNKYNELGRLMILLLYYEYNEKSETTIIEDLKELAKEFDDLYVYEKILSFYNRIPIKSHFRELIITSLYNQLRSINDYSEKRLTLLSKYENELLDISSSRISNIDMIF